MTEQLKPCPFCKGPAMEYNDGLACCADSYCPGHCVENCELEDWNRRTVSVQEALTVAASLEAWATALRAGRTVEPSIVGLSDMARSLRALAEGERG